MCSVPILWDHWKWKGGKCRYKKMDNRMLNCQGMHKWNDESILCSIMQSSFRFTYYSTVLQTSIYWRRLCPSEDPLWLKHVACYLCLECFNSSWRCTTFCRAVELFMCVPTSVKTSLHHTTKEKNMDKVEKVVLDILMRYINGVKHISFCHSEFPAGNHQCLSGLLSERGKGLWQVPVWESGLLLPGPWQHTRQGTVRPGPICRQHNSEVNFPKMIFFFFIEKDKKFTTSSWLEHIQSVLWVIERTSVSTARLQQNGHPQRRPWEDLIGWTEIKLHLLLPMSPQKHFSV